MYIRTWIFVSALLLFASGQTVVHALPFCGCGYCAMAATGKCTCSSPYHWCSDDSDASQFGKTDDSRMPEVSSTHELTFPATKDVIEGVQTVMTRGTCLHNKVTLHLLRSTGGNLPITRSAVGNALLFIN